MPLHTSPILTGVPPRLGMHGRGQRSRHSGCETTLQSRHFSEILPNLILFPQGTQDSGLMTWKETFHLDVSYIAHAEREETTSCLHSSNRVEHTTVQPSEISQCRHQKVWVRGSQKVTTLHSYSFGDELMQSDPPLVLWSAGLHLYLSLRVDGLLEDILRLDRLRIPLCGGWAGETGEINARVLHTILQVWANTT